MFGGVLDRLDRKGIQEGKREERARGLPSSIRYDARSRTGRKINPTRQAALGVVRVSNRGPPDYGFGEYE